jgi:hypothetical protein
MYGTAILNFVGHAICLLRNADKPQSDGNWLLRDYPLRGLKLPREEDVRRPIASHDRFLKLREAISTLAETAPQKRGRQRWRRLELALVLVRQPAPGSAQFAGSGGLTSRTVHPGSVGGRSSTRRVGSDLSRFPRAWSRSYGVSRRSWVESEMVGCSRARMAPGPGRATFSASSCS